MYISPRQKSKSLLYRADNPPRTPLIRGAIQTTGSGSFAVGTDAELVNTMQLAEGQEATREQMLRASFIYYASEMIQGPPQAPYNGRFLVGYHHVRWDRLVRQNLRILIKASRDHGKTFAFSVAYPLWQAHKHMPGSLGYIFSSSQELAEERLEELKQQVDRNKKLEELLPPSGEDAVWNKREVRLATGTIIRARGWGTRVRGGHPHWIVCDDVLTDEAIYSDTIRRRQIDYFFSVPSNMIVPGGQICVCGTPMSEGDLYARIEQTGQYAKATFPARDKHGRALFPERYDEAALKKKEEEIGAARFAREFLCRPCTDEASLFPAHLFEGPDVRLPYTLGLDWRFWEKRGAARFTGVDLAMSAETGADYTVIFTVALDGEGNRWIANIRRGKGWSFQHQLDQIKEEYALMRSDVIHIEANQAQRIFTDELRRTTDLPIRMFFTSGVQPKKEWRHGMTSITMGKNNLDRGLPSVRMTLENKKWRIPRGDKNSIELTDAWINEMGLMTFQDGKVISVGEHDDTAMACWMADVAARTGGVSFEFVGAGDEIKQSIMGLLKMSETHGPATMPVSPGPQPSAEVLAARMSPAPPPEEKESEEVIFDPFGFGL